MFYCYENEKKIEIKESLLSFPLNKTLKFNLAECSFSYMVTYLRQQIKVPSVPHYKIRVDHPTRSKYEHVEFYITFSFILQHADS